MLLATALFAAALNAPCQAGLRPAAGRPIRIPAADLNDRFFAIPRLVNGRELRFYTDTGGGTFVFKNVAKSGAFPIRQSGDSFAVFPRLDCRAALPNPNNQGLAVVPLSEVPRLKAADPIQGVLGASWFDKRTWTWDYPGRALYWRAEHDVPAVAANHAVHLGFQMHAREHATGFPRIAATIDGQTYQFLFDTGAETLPTANTAEQLHIPQRWRAGSFITRSIAARWHRAHPDWPYIAHGEAQSHEDMIRVPNVRIAGYDSGTAWFSTRPDRNFTRYMSQWMDQTVVGSIGGAVLHPFRVTVDYSREKAYFEQP